MIEQKPDMWSWHKPWHNKNNHSFKAINLRRLNCDVHFCNSVLVENVHAQKYNVLKLAVPSQTLFPLSSIWVKQCGSHYAPPPPNTPCLSEKSLTHTHTHTHIHTHRYTYTHTHTEAPLNPRQPTPPHSDHHPYHKWGWRKQQAWSLVTYWTLRWVAMTTSTGTSCFWHFYHWQPFAGLQKTISSCKQ